MEDALANPFDPTPRPAGTPAARKPWTLDHSGFQALLSALDPDPGKAALRYAALRDRLSRFFEWNNADGPDALADQVLDRLTRRITTATSQDEAVRQPEKFASGIARLLLHEQWRERTAAAQMLNALQQSYETLPKQRHEQQQLERAHHLLEECLETLAPAQRELIQRYYSVEARNQIEARKQLAAASDISLNALRNRALRIRADVESCLRGKLERFPA